MSQCNLDRIFQPRRVAVVGASESTGSIGNALMENLIEGGFQGELLPVNAKYHTVHGMSAVESVSALETGVDLAVITTPIHTVPGIVRECVEKKIAGAMIISAGKEVGERGIKIEERIRATAHAGGLRIMGPNCLGIIRPSARLNASFASEMPDIGDLAFVSQNGAICTAILDLALKDNIGFSHFVNVGSMLDVDFGDIIDYLGNDPSTKSILLYIENLTNFHKFMSAAHAVSRVKPIIVLKTGKNGAKTKAAGSHTRTMAGGDPVNDATFKRPGSSRVDAIQDLFDCAELMAKQPRPLSPRLAIVSDDGGPGVTAKNTLARYGLEPAPLAPETFQKLNAFLAPFWSRGNPVDTLEDASAERFCRTLEICFDGKDTDGVCVILAPQASTDPSLVAEALASMMKGRRYLVFGCRMGGKSIVRAL